MYQIRNEDLLLLLENMRQIRQRAGETIAFLEHLMELQQPQKKECQVDYDPDAYLAQWINETDMVPRSQYAETIRGDFVIGGDRNA